MVWVLAAMMWRINERQSLRNRLTRFFGLLFSTLILAIGAGAMALIHTNEQAAWRGRQNEAAESAANRVSAFMFQNLGALRLAALFDPHHLAQETKMVDVMLSPNTALLEITRLDQAGNVLMTQAQGKSFLDAPMTRQPPEWFAVAEDGKTFVGEIELSAQNEPYIIIAVPAPDGGVVAARFGVNLLWQVVQEIRFGNTGSVYLVDEHGHIIAHHKTELVVQHTELNPGTRLAQVVEADERLFGERYTNFSGDTVIGVTYAIPDTNWVVVAEVAESEVLGRYHVAFVFFVVGAVVVFALGIRSTLNLLEQRVLEPLRVLHAGAARVGQGSLDEPVKVTQQDEIGVVAAAFNDMMEKLRRRDDELAAQTAALTAEVEEHLRTELALSQSEATNRAILDAIPDALFRFNTLGKLLSYKTSKDSTVLSVAHTMVGKTLHEFLPAALRQRAAQALEQVLRTRAVETFEFDLEEPGGRLEFEARIAIVGADEVLVIVRDMTERKRREELLRATLARERQVGELKTRFMRLMSHEFRTPLSVILTSNDLLARISATMPAEKRERYFGIIRSQVHHLTRILDDILLVSRAESVGLDLHRQPLNLEQYCHSIVQEFIATAPDNTVVFTAKDADCFVNLDERMMRQALVNLLANAVKYSQVGSPVYFNVTCDDEQLVIQIRDAGIGIPAEDQEHLFTVFHRAQNIDYRPGAGLGLVIVKHVVRGHGGNVTCQSEVGVGSIFTVTIPRLNLPVSIDHHNGRIAEFA
jgi:signal transduction histidine kinase